MNIDNIKLIMSSNLWRNMEKHKGYIDYKIINTDQDNPDNKQFHCLLVFFDHRTPLARLRHYMEEGRRMAQRESLDFYDKPLYFYSIQAIVFS
jgi:hypothetical protein